MGNGSTLGITSAGNGGGAGIGICSGGTGSGVKGSGGSSSCCDLTVKCRCRWRVGHNCLLSPSFVFFIAALLVISSIAFFYAWLVFTPFARMPLPIAGLSSFGCQVDREGSWSIGVFYGDSPFFLQPIEEENVWRNRSSAWPVANPVVTCSSVSAAGSPSNFVSDPFLYIQDEALYLFFQTKNSITNHGDIGLAKSVDNGATWQHLGIVLDEEWHISYPYVFNYLDQVYMMPESSQKGEVRLYRAVSFPLEWKLESIIIKKPLVDSVMIEHENMYWVLGSDNSAFGVRKNGQLEIWYANSPLGPWKPHKKNPIYNVEKSYGARNGGRPFILNGSLYRVGQDSGEMYGRRARIFKVEVLNKDEYREVEVQLGFTESKKGRNAWNGVRHHHLDVQRLSSGQWIGVMDGDRVPPNDSIRRVLIGSASFLGVGALIVLVGVILGAVRSIVPYNWCGHSLGKRSDASLIWERSNAMSVKVMRLCNRLNRLPSSFRVWVKPESCKGRLILLIIFCVGVSLMCIGVKYTYGGNGAEEPYAVMDHYSQFTMLAMTYDARLWNLKMYVKHYSRCSSVREIVVVWNKGVPPDPNDFDSAVPVRIRVEERNSLNNRFKIDPLIKTKAVLELDDDIMMLCDDVERGFKVWRDHPDRIIGFYPRLVDGSPLKYRAEKYARRKKGYNMILTGAAFMDSEFAFQKYWSDEAREGREVVDQFFNCEDVLMNHLYANASLSDSSVEYVKPAWAIDTSKLSNVAISRDTNTHYGIRSECLSKFAEMYGGLAHLKSAFNGRGDGWDV